MKKIVILLALALVLNSCAPVVVVDQKPKKMPPGQADKKMPPGQMKKVTGSQSAKPYAPGQQKKRH